MELDGENVVGVVGVEMDEVVDEGDVRIRVRWCVPECLGPSGVCGREGDDVVTAAITGDSLRTKGEDDGRLP